MDNKSQETKAGQTKATLLIVDDTPTNLAVLSNYLKDSGLRILVARSGEKALERARYVQPDLILLDVMMPGINGFETCRRLKADRLTQDIPVIFMTALAEAKDKVTGFNVGAVDYVTKPLQHEEVLARVSTHLKLQALTRDLQTQNVELQETTTALSKRNRQLQISSQVGQEVTTILDMDELLPRVVSLIQAKFDYYFVGVWLLDKSRQNVVLRAGASGAAPQPTAGLEIPLNQENSAIAWVCRHGQDHLANDVSQAEYYLALESLPDVQSELVLPFRFGQEVIGVLDITSDQLAAFNEEDRLLLQTLADQIAIAIRNARLYRSEKQGRHFAEALVKTGQVISSDLRLGQVPERILSELAGVVPYARGSILVEQDNVLQSIVMRGYPSERAGEELHIFINEGGVFERIRQSSAPLRLDDVTIDPGWQQLEWLPLDYSWLGVPLIAKDQVMGMISLTRRERQAFTPDDATSVRAFAGQAAIALENARLYDEIRTFNDHLEEMVDQRTAELAQAYDTLARLDRKKSDFINITSHELRTPLSVIKGYAQILEIKPAISEDDEVQELVSGLVQGVNRLDQIVGTMLDVVKIETEALEVGHEPTSLLKIIQRLYDRYMDDLTRRQLDLVINGIDHLPTIQANPDLIYKAFNNLIANAIKYTPDGGQIKVSGQALDGNAECPAVEIIISDTGIGIDPEHQIEIFDKFYQTGKVAVHSSGDTKFKGGGPGLGLAITKGIITAHYGQIWVESEGYDESTCPGSHFHVRLPIQQPSDD